MANRNREYIDFLKQRFDEYKFIEFISDLLNLSSNDINLYVSEQKPEQKQFRDTIEYYKFIANYESNSDRIGTFIVKLTDDGSQNARTAQRTFISTLLNKYNLDASLVAFYQDNEPSWRLSFVKKELSFTENGIKVDLTPAKRFSYLVGENESVHTAQEYLFSLLNIEDRKITLSDIEKVFDVEKVTKKFFEEYKEKYLELKEFLDKNDDFITESENCDFTSEEFAKKLMGQIVFLYFLQKKGWLGVQIVPDELTSDEYDEISKQTDSVCNNLLEKYYVKADKAYKLDKNSLKSETIKDNINNFISIFKGTKYDKAWGTGDKQFVRNMFKKSRLDHKDNFFDDYLEQLFYTGLNEKRENQYFVLFNCKIPFLNGGLFEPINNYRWSSAQFNIPDEMFSNDKKAGILDIFDLYNFTIDEEEPLEKEIAVDPEMLGKIFENLLDVKDRKSTGSFYTPREIVHYMCQESLANYIVNKLNIPYKDIINFIKYGDVLTQTDWTKIYNDDATHILPDSIWNNLIEIDKALLDVKIADPAVGSGAFPLGILNEIVKLRDNISSYILIQEDKNIISRENISEEQLLRDIYSMKLQTIQNSIYAVDIEMSAIDIAKLRLWLSLIVDFPNNSEPKPLPNLDCKIMQGNSLIDEFEGTKLFSKKLYKKSNRKNAAKVTVQKSILSEPIYVEQSFALDGTNALEEDLFGELLRYQKQFFVNSNSNEKKIIKSKIESIQFKIIEKSFENNNTKLIRLKELEEKRVKQWFIWELEFYDVFESNGGFDIVIGNPPYIDSERMKNEMPKERKLYAKKYIYAKGNWDIYITFFELAYNLLNDTGNMIYITPDKWVSKPFGDALRCGLIKNISSIMVAGRDVFESVNVDSIITNIKKDKTKEIIIKSLNNNEKKIDKKMISKPYKLDLLFSDYLDLLLKISSNKKTMSDKYNIMTESACATSDAYILKEIIYDNLFNDSSSKYRVVNTGTIEPFNTRYGSKEMVYLKDKYMNPVVNKESFHQKFKNKYATMVNCNKIIMKGLNLLDAFIDFDGDIIPGKTTLVIKNNDINKLKLILGFLQSKCIYFYIKESYSASSYNGGITFTKDMIDNIPIPSLSQKDEQKIIEFVDNLINKNYYETNLEFLNNFIYKLYNLSEEEVKIIEETI